MPELTNLSELVLADCSSLRTLGGMPELPNLQQLNLSGCPLENLEGMPDLPNLETLVLDDCSDLRTLSEMPSLPKLRYLSLNGCEKLENYERMLQHYIYTGPEGEIGNRRKVFERVRAFLRTGSGWLDFSGLNISKLPAFSSNLPGLTRLKISNCPNLQNVEDLGTLTALRELHLSNCPNLHNVEGLGTPTALKVLVLSNCPNLQNVETLKTLSSLTTLDLSNCPLLQNVDVQNLAALDGLNLSNCPNLQSVDVQNLTSLINLYRDPFSLERRDSRLFRSFPSAAFSPPSSTDCWPKLKFSPSENNVTT
jgi:Leucine-rich repeat (LRR) protein